MPWPGMPGHRVHGQTSFPQEPTQGLQASPTVRQMWEEGRRKAQVHWNMEQGEIGDSPTLL